MPECSVWHILTLLQPARVACSRVLGPLDTLPPLFIVILVVRGHCTRSGRSQRYKRSGWILEFEETPSAEYVGFKWRPSGYLMFWEEGRWRKGFTPRNSRTLGVISAARCHRAGLFSPSHFYHPDRLLVSGAPFNMFMVVPVNGTAYFSNFAPTSHNKTVGKAKSDISAVIATYCTFLSTYRFVCDQLKLHVPRIQGIVT